MGVDRVSANLNFMIFGDLFFHHQVIVFDKVQNRIGFIISHNSVNLFPNLYLFTPITYALVIMAVLAVVMVLCMRRNKKLDQSKAQLFEPFTGKSV